MRRSLRLVHFYNKNVFYTYKKFSAKKSSPCPLLYNKTFFYTYKKFSAKKSSPCPLLYNKTFFYTYKKFSAKNYNASAHCSIKIKILSDFSSNRDILYITLCNFNFMPLKVGSCSFKGKRRFISLSTFGLRKISYVYMHTSACARADDTKIVRVAQCITEESPLNKPQRLIRNILETRHMRGDCLQLFMTCTLGNIMDSSLENRWAELSPSIAIINLVRVVRKVTLSTG